MTLDQEINKKEGIEGCLGGFLVPEDHPEPSLIHCNPSKLPKTRFLCIKFLKSHLNLRHFKDFKPRDQQEQSIGGCLEGLLGPKVAPEPFSIK